MPLIASRRRPRPTAQSDRADRDEFGVAGSSLDRASARPDETSSGTPASESIDIGTTKPMFPGDPAAHNNPISLKLVCPPRATITWSWRRMPRPSPMSRRLVGHLNVGLRRCRVARRMIMHHDHRRRAELQGALHHLARIHRGVVDAAGLPDRQSLTFIPAGTAPPFTLTPLLFSPKDKSKQERGRDDDQRQNGAHRRAAARRSMIGQGR